MVITYKNEILTFFIGVIMKMTKKLWIVGTFIVCAMMMGSTASAWWWDMNPPGTGPIDGEVKAGTNGFVITPGWIHSTTWYTGGPFDSPEVVPVGGPLESIVFGIDYELFAHDIDWNPGVRLVANAYLDHKPAGSYWRIVDSTSAESIDQDLNGATWNIETGTMYLSHYKAHFNHGDQYRIIIHLYAYWAFGGGWMVGDMETPPDWPYYYISTIQPVP